MIQLDINELYSVYNDALLHSLHKPHSALFLYTLWNNVTLWQCITQLEEMDGLLSGLEMSGLSSFA